MNSEVQGGSTTVFPAVGSALDGTQWRYWLSPDGPQPDGEKPRDSYADWMKRQEVQGHGVYLWLWPLQNEEWRFFHVGMAKRGSTMAERTICHCQSAYRTDQIRQIPLEGYGPLGPDTRGGKEKKEELSQEQIAQIDRLLATTRILFLRPDGVEDASEAIRQLEGAIYWAAVPALGADGVTNDAKPARLDFTEEEATAVRAWLNQMHRMIPD